jgi:hypothetical protein
VATQPVDQLREALAALLSLPLSSPIVAAIAEGVADAAPEAAYMLLRTGYGSMTINFANKKYEDYEMRLTGKKVA